MNQGEFLVIRERSEVPRRLEYLHELLTDLDVWPLSLKWGKYTSPRTLNQNALFHMWLNEASKHFEREGKRNVEPERLKLLLKNHFLGTIDVEVGSQVVPGVIRSTRKLDKAEMQRFMEQCELWFLDMGVKLTIPGDSEYMTLREAQIT